MDRAKPNILVLLVDEERYPPVYETPAAREWRSRHLAAQRMLREHALEFHRHYIGSSACSPSRATLLTGQYPSLHGVTQTTGIAKEPFDSDMFWLDANTVPTMGDYFRAAGYRTYYKGKWHVSFEDIVVPGTHRSVSSYDPVTGVPVPAKGGLYARADRLGRYGFAGWIGPEPHGRDPRNSGSSAAAGLPGRDGVYAAETVRLLEALGRARRGGAHPEPWLVVASFVNPHDIVLYGAVTARMRRRFRFEAGPSVPDIPPAPSAGETLRTKPRCQASYRDIYPLALQPIGDEPFYRRLYYRLQENADRQMAAVLDALKRSPFYEDTIVVFTSDHGELLGSHGGLHQKWHCAYEEALRVPLLIHSPRLFPRPAHSHALTSHVDLLPTLLGLAGADPEAVRQRLRGRFSEARPLSGRNLAPYVGGGRPPAIPDAPVYFLTLDDPTKGQHQVSPFGRPYPAVTQPNGVETVIAAVGADGRKQLWKLSRYFDSSPVEPGGGGTPVPDEYELYNVAEDPMELRNLAHPAFADARSRAARAELLRLLADERARKRLTPEASDA
ncbi:sulfatase-like hydrolase/transferase [Paenibacillus sp. MWE-103]|uniref:Sulfatase-like hydrolase/transferase n=1 Tax=Paenibacillus artemisiicola TaxID=1172618 RepID=A0ABS3WD52_9BACL|nr:sulfatase-like hydrolase/transferase [Paenibacillus artemisiicola]MBO7746250.1 sulfatase-like hydrolase/transferase [Paenibacillus artemisiicola]